jgi:alkylated DNA nucleotide flippase Atl1
MAAIVERIRRIPYGTVQSYGGIDPEAPRLVGRVLATTHQNLPWHRVVRADGSIPRGKEGVPMRADRVDVKHARSPR